MGKIAKYKKKRRNAAAREKELALNVGSAFAGYAGTRFVSRMV